MKKFKKLIPALCMLLVSAVMLGGTTFAWFSMNTTVKATDMQVTAKSNATYLLISDSSTKTGATTTLTDTVVANYEYSTQNADKKVYPVKYFKNATETSTIGSVQLKDASGYDSSTWLGDNKWFTANNGNATSANDDVKNIKAVEISNYDYILKYTVYLTLSKDSADISEKVKVTYSATGADASVKSVVVIDGEYLEVASGSSTATTTNEVNIKNNATVEVFIYVYIDGDSANVNSNYLNSGTDLKGNVSIQFDLAGKKAE